MKYHNHDNESVINLTGVFKQGFPGNPAKHPFYIPEFLNDMKASRAETRRGIGYYAGGWLIKPGERLFTPAKWFFIAGGETPEPGDGSLDPGEGFTNPAK